MSKKLPMVFPLLIAVVISWIFPATILGVTKDFKPKKLTNWSGYAEHEITSAGHNSYYRKTSGPLLVGYKHDLASSFFWYRGFVKFDVSSLPADACVSNIVLIGNSMTATAGHTLAIRRLMIDPVTAGFIELYDAIKGGGAVYKYCSSCMRSSGSKSITLPSSANGHLESAQAQGWFALGFTESNEDNFPGMWQGSFDPSPPILRVTYSVPPHSAPIVSATHDSICADNQYCISWNSIPGATSYLLSENGSLWGDVGPGTSRCFTKTVAGDFSYLIKARNSCGMSAVSQAVTVKVIDKPATPIKPTVSSFPYCTNNSFQISWASLPDAVSYEIRENNGPWTNVGNLLQQTFNKTSPGTYSYTVRGVNMCGTGGFFSPSVSVTVQAPPASPAKLVVSGGPHCIKSDYTISWSPVNGAESYQIREGVGRWTDAGNLLQQTFNKTSPGTYSYTVRGVNMCGTSNPSPLVSVKVQTSPATPTRPVASGGPHCIKSDYTISWSPVDGAESYQIREGVGRWTDAGNNSKYTFNHRSSGIYKYTVRALNACEVSRPSEPVSVTVKATPAVPVAPVSNSDTILVNEQYTVSWNAVAGATYYELIEDAGNLVYSGRNLQTSMTKSSAGDFTYSVKACNECYCSSMSRSLALKISDSLGCCVASTGNIDCDPNEITDITDLTVLIDHLFIDLKPLCCEREGNVDGDPSGLVDITDLAFLIDHLFISLIPTSACQ